MKYMLVAIFFMLSVNASAIGNMVANEIVGVYVRESRIDILLKSDHENPAGCKNSRTVVILANEHENSDLMFSAVLSAHMANRKISGWLGSCHGDWAKFTAVNVEK